MTLGKFLLRTIVMALAWFALGYVGHQLLLRRDYVAIEPIMRTKADMQAHLMFAPLSGLFVAAAMVWIYAQGRSTKPWLGQGLRFGVAVWAIAAVPQYIANYTIEPWPGVFVIKILAWELIAAMVLGVLVAGLSKNDGVARANTAGA
jgi:hypothetical protein